ncbi:MULTISPECIES: c-type cytochrome [Cupriavidus]|uniref:Cytochrome c domain-containing protein n=1 Tax=Cupriavidus nantongensis TaxID=1796606 RepID=A0A142JJY8_9BURK|nr:MULTISPECIES: cytochrome c [Cupriavidus]AMR78400.1 hypothetical protein A2G96_12010 [Cupriavidus nantongensis]BDB30523.1 cytochrome c [Cupriavidus sp. P-10]
MRTFTISIIALLLLAAAAVFGIAYSGAYSVAADEPHWPITEKVLAMVRSRAIGQQADKLEPPNLNDAQRVLKGAGQYASMCVACHRAPGLPDSQLTRGLYPAPPRLDQGRADPKHAFVVIKHGLKMTGMPAWGSDHDDEAIWDLVAFLDKLPALTPTEYRDMVDRSAGDNNEQFGAEIGGHRAAGPRQPAAQASGQSGAEKGGQHRQ